ncbi:MAG: sugar transferase [Dorea sp.]|nr:sugar transferase [Dorea sp.]
MKQSRTASADRVQYMKMKNIIDRILGGIGLVVLSPVYLGIILAIKAEDGIKAPVFFSQKRIGIHKTYFQLYKFRSMKVDTPHDQPTHLLENPEQYITKVGHFLRKTSLDELPQLWNIVKGDMAVIGPRPALWNQDDLIAERDQYGANDVKPGLTGWAQINGRDELEIEYKAKLDGDYVRKMGPLMDIRCFFGTIFSVLRSDGVVEGGTGAMKKKKRS